MYAEISSVSQNVDLKTGSSSFSLTLTLPGGRAVHASISPEDAQVLLASVVGGDDVAPLEAAPIAVPAPAFSAPRPAVPAPSMFDAPEGAVIFGGQEQPAEVPPDWAAPPQTAPAPVQPPVRRRMVNVPSDEYGYPKIGGQVDTGEVTGTGTGDADEEGIGQG